MILINIFLDSESIFHCTKCKKFINTCSLKLRLRRLCTWRKNKFIIIFFKYFIIRQILYCNSLTIRMYRDNFMMNLHIDTKSFKEILWCLQCKFFRVCDYISNVVWKSTICIRYVSGSFKYSNFSIFVQSSYSCCGCSSTGYASYNYNFHLVFSPFLSKQKYPLEHF